MLARVTALMGIATRLKLARLLFVTDARPELGALVAAVVRGGADAVALEDPALSTRDALAALADVRDGVRGRQPLVAYRGAADVAGEFGADALLLADDATDARKARRVVSEWTVVGRSCNTAAEVDAALADPDVHFLLVGPGLDHIRHAAAVAPQDDPASKPWFAAGGITARTLDIVLGAGALRVAVGRGIRDTDDPAATTRAFADRLREAWAADPKLDAVVDAAFGPGPRLGFPPSTTQPGPTDLTI